MTGLMSRRGFAGRVAAVIPVVGLLTPEAAVAAVSGRRAPEDEISRTAEAIHQEVVFHASPARVYGALVVTNQFAQATGGQATQISADPGGAFSLFGGQIVGRQVELTPDKRIVQAWRVAAWPAGIYSIARFDLREEGTTTRLVFDHTGFPIGAAGHLASGWKANYWTPLAKYLV
jgi:activator of HSP90 ATPase